MPEIRRAPVETAFAIKEKIKETLGFTVNIGVGNNKAMAKMAGELKKPDMVHTLWPEEIQRNCGPSCQRAVHGGKSHHPKIVPMQHHHNRRFGSGGREFPAKYFEESRPTGSRLCQRYRSFSRIINGEVEQKGLGNSLTLPYDATTKKELFLEALALCERVGMRLRRLNRRASLVSVYLKNSSFAGCGHQVQLPIFINSTSEIYGNFQTAH